VTRTREVLQSCDPKVSQAGIEVKTGQKWRAAEGLKQGLTVSNKTVRRAIKLVPEAVEVASRWLWIRRVALPGHKPGLDQPRLGRLEEGV